MNKIWYLCLEPLESRYTKDWLTQFPEVWKSEGRDFETILGEPQAKEINRKFFLDPLGTNKWKLTQLNKLINRIDEVKENDVIFIPDGWYPGIEILGYIRNMMGRKFKLVSYWHAGTWDEWDLISQKGMQWASGLEVSWLEMYDVNLVATEFHKGLIQKRYGEDIDIQVVGFPLDIEGIRKHKYNLPGAGIMFTGRLSYEKGLDVINYLKEKHYNVCTLSELRLTREEYYNRLAQGSVVIAPSLQETFGIGIIEGMALGLTPVAPNRLSFLETIPEEYRYDSRDEMIEIINKGLKESKEFDLDKHQYQNVIKKMLRYF